jgi:hypothetical protein
MINFLFTLKYLVDSSHYLKNKNSLMTCYKLVTVEFKWFGLQGRVENHIMNTEQRIFNLFHR